MNDRIDWGDGSFEFITKEELDRRQVKRYSPIFHLPMCKYCIEKKCTANVIDIERGAAVVFNRCFKEDFADETLLFSNIKNYLVEIQDTFGKDKSKGTYVCALIHILQLVDEETMVDVTDEMTSLFVSKFIILLES